MLTIDPLCQNHPNPYWPANLLGLGVAYFVHARIRRRLPRTFPTFTTLRLGELYGMLAVAHAAAQERLLYRTQVLQDPDLHTLEMVAIRQRHRWTEIQNSVRQQPEYTQIKPFDIGECFGRHALFCCADFVVSLQRCNTKQGSLPGRGCATTFGPIQ